MLFQSFKKSLKSFVSAFTLIALVSVFPGVAEAQRGGGGGPAFNSMSCIFDVQVEQGGTATFFVSAGTSGGFSDPLEVVLIPNPSGPYMSNAPLWLSPNADPAYNYSGPAIVETVSADPGLYTMDFSITYGGITRTCQTYLTITAPLYVDLEFNGSDGPVALDSSAGGAGTLSWSAAEAQSCIGSMTAGADTSSPTQWSGSQTVPVFPGSELFNVSNLQENQSYTFKITCYDVYSNTVEDTVTVSVSSAPVATSVTLYCKTTTGQDDLLCPVQSGSSGILIWETTNATACQMTDNQVSTPNWPGGGWVSPLNEPTGQATGNITTNTTYTLSCTGPSGQTDSDTVMFDTYILPETPNAPTISLDNSYCGYIKITLTPDVPPDFTQWYLGWGTSAVNITQELGGETTPVLVERDLGGNILPLEWWHGSTPTPPPGVDPDYYTYSPEPETDNYYKGAAINTYTTDPGPSGPEYDFSAWSNGVESVGGPINVDQCDLNLSNSDLDVLSVGTLNNSNPDLDECTGIGPNDGHETIPGFRVFSVGERVKYKVNVCNDGEYPFTNVTVTNTLENLVLDDSTIEFSPECGASRNPYEPVDDTHFILNFTDLPAPAPGDPMNACSATFEAITVAPSGASSQLYRFRSSGLLSVDGATESLMSIDYSFRYGASIPFRGER